LTTWQCEYKSVRNLVKKSVGRPNIWSFHIAKELESHRTHYKQLLHNGCH
jgi:hypothetical protein